MLKLKDIEDALLSDIRANITGIKTAETHEAEFDESTLTNLIPRAPFILVRYGGTDPDEGERHADGSSGVSGREFHLTVAAASLRTKKEAQRGCYDLLDALRERYDGLNLVVGSSSVTLAYDGDMHRVTTVGLVIYTLYLKWSEN